MATGDTSLDGADASTACMQLPVLPKRHCQQQMLRLCRDRAVLTEQDRAYSEDGLYQAQLGLGQPLAADQLEALETRQEAEAGLVSTADVTQPARLTKYVIFGSEALAAGNIAAAWPLVVKSRAE